VRGIEAVPGRPAVGPFADVTRDALVAGVPGGIPNEINATSAERMLAGVKPASPVEAARHALALEHLDDLRRLDAQM
jgi:hypothetical protein